MFREFMIDEFNVIIGRNAQENDELSINVAHSNDLWFHVSGYAGSHGIIRNPDNKKIEKDTIKKVAAIVAYYSKARDVSVVTVHYCKSLYVTKKKNSPAGEVIISNYNSIKVKPSIMYEEEGEQIQQTGKEKDL